MIYLHQFFASAIPSAPHFTMTAKNTQKKKLRNKPACTVHRLALKKHSPDELLHTASLALKSGDLKKAEAAAREILRQKPEHPDGMFTMALICHLNGQLPQAEKFYERTLARYADHLSALKNYGLLLHQTGRSHEALGPLSHASALHPNDLETLNNLGSVHQSLGQYQDAKHFHEKALTLAPNHPVTLTNLGNIAQLNDELATAEHLFKQVLATTPEFLPARTNLGKLFLSKHLYGAALRCFEKVLALNPHHTEAYAPIASALLDFGRIEEGLAWLKKAVQAFPLDQALASSFAASLHYHHGNSDDALRAATKNWWHTHGAKLIPDTHTQKTNFAATPIRVGYLSPDFRNHPVTYFLLPVLAHHDRHTVTTYCFSSAPEESHDSYSAKIQAACDHWHCIADLSDEQAAKLVQECGIDLLIDVSGHTRNNRLLLFAHRPAPVQMSWLGYQGTTGIPMIQYRLTDPVADPATANENGYSEHLIRLPHAFFCFEPPVEAPKIIPLPADQTGHITLGCVNNQRKISQAVIALWAKVLHRIPGAVLTIANHQMADHEVRLYCRQQLAQYGIAEERLNLLPSVAFSEYLHLLGSIDILLDPFPLNGHTVTCQALWMGAPLITQAGSRFGSRLGATILHALGLEELVAETPEQYVDIAADLATNHDRLRQLRMGMRQRMLASPVCDVKTFTTDLEKCFQNLLEKNAPKRTAGNQSSTR